MNKTDIYWHLSSTGLATQAGVLEAEQKNHGVNGIVILDLFNKNFCSEPKHYDLYMEYWCDKFNKAVFNNNQSRDFPIKEAILNIRESFFCDMTPAQINNSTCEYKALNPLGYTSTCKYASRHMPLDLVLYEDRLDKFFAYLTSLGIASKCTIDLWGEPNAARYWWGTFAEFIILDAIKKRVCRRYGLKMLSAHLTASAIIDPLNYGGFYADHVSQSPDFEQPDLGYSTSLYKNASKGMVYDYDSNYFPTRQFNRTILVECGWAAGLSDTSTNPVNKAKWDYFNSKMMMHYFVDLLKYSIQVNCTTVCLFVLVDNFEKDGKGILSFWKHLDGGGYIQKPVWFVYRDLMSVIKGGYDPTQDGIIGANGKRIVITGSGYSIV